MRDSGRYKKDPKPPGKLVFDKTIAVDNKTDEMVESKVDLSPALSGRYGQVLVVVEPRPWTNKWAPPRLIAWVQATEIGLDAFIDGEELVGWATDLNNGKAKKGVKLSLVPTGISGTTDSKGLARLP